MFTTSFVQMYICQQKSLSFSKLNNMKKLLSGALLLLISAMLIPASHLKAQDTGNDKKVHIRITKEINGVTTIIDTTFSETGQGDIDAFLDQNGMNEDINDDYVRKTDKIIKIEIPDIEEELSDLDLQNLWPDTLALSDNIRIYRNAPREFDFNWQEYPDIRFHYDNPDIEGNPHHFEFQMPPMPNFENLPPQLDLRPFLRGDHEIKIKNKRHGKKIIIRTYDDDKDHKCKKDHDDD